MIAYSKQHPLNYMLLGAFTICEALMVGVSCAFISGTSLLVPLYLIIKRRHRPPRAPIRALAVIFGFYHEFLSHKARVNSIGLIFLLLNNLAFFVVE